MGMRAQVAQELLDGMMIALGDREPNEAILRKMEELEATIAEDDEPQCVCGAWQDGRDCLCHETY